MTIDIEVNNRLKKVRQTLDLNQKEMAELLQVQQSYYSEVENGKRPVTGKIVKLLNEQKSISSDWLYSGKGEMIITNSESSKGSLRDILSSESKKILNDHHAEFNDITERLKNTHNPLNDKEKIILKNIEENEKYSLKHEQLNRKYNNIKRSALIALKNEDKGKGCYLELLTEFARLVDVLGSVTLNYFDVFYEGESVPMDIIMGYKAIPSVKEYKDDFNIQLEPLIKYKKNVELLTAQISAFLQKIKEIDTQDIIAVNT